MTPHYSTFDILQRHKAQLRDSVPLTPGFQLASWTNHNDCVTHQSDHHTLSLYIADGYETYKKTTHGWHNGGGPDRFCLMPENSETVWDVRNSLSFVHLYFTQKHLLQLAEQIWDRSPRLLQLDEKTFLHDKQITSLYRHFLLSSDWHQPANHLMLSSAATLLLTHVVQHYSTVNWQLPGVRGGLAPAVLRHVLAYIEAHLSQPLSLEVLAAEAGLSDFHFARMFKHSTHLAPHQYVMQQRMAHAKMLLTDTRLPLGDIAMRCGFSSASHFSNRFKTQWGITPSQLRAGAK